ncbi:hypothetical protein [Chryseobacterium sp.]|uniref:hypothetical protein n=1 Tax=Chryseobacterium sp. TaxID=1871047 RepID=UPI002FC83B58
MKKLIFIHGRDQHGKDPKELKNLWIKSFKEGLEKSGLTINISEDDILMPFYGDKLDYLVNNLDSILDNIVNRGNEDNLLDTKEMRFSQEFLSEIAQNANISESELQEQYNLDLRDRGILNWPWILSILRAIDKRGNWGELSIKKFTYDVFLYLTNNNIKRIINDIVLQKIPNDPCIVVGHSLGSIVGYNILRDNPKLKIIKYITIGSPLGVNAIKNKLSTPIKMPECINEGYWYNAFDPHDTVSLNSLDENNFNISPLIKNYGKVDNYTENQHGIEGYLSDSFVAKEIYNALS